MMPGGHSDIQTITPELQQKVQALQPLATAFVGGGGTWERFEAISYTRQVVAGTIYHFKVLIYNDDDDDACLHMKVFEPLPHTGQPMEILKIQKAKKDDVLAPL
jgi:hypothetical protein